MAEVHGSGKLRLRAADAEDLGVISACLQDARVPLREMVYVPTERRFASLLTRYRRERQADPSSCDGLTEVQAALILDNVEQVRYRGFDPEDRDRELVLLTIATEPGRKHLVRVDLVFEGEARIRLLTNALAARFEDFGMPAPCRVTPCDHETGGLPGWTESYDYKA